jgi:leucyl aminopeptidase
MKVLCSAQKARSFRGPVLVVGAFQGTASHEGVLKELDAASKGWVARVLSSGDFRGKLGDALVQQTHGALPSGRLMLLGLGEREKFTLDRWRGAVAKAAQASRGLRARQFGVSLELPSPVAFSMAELGAAATEGAMLGLYRFGLYKSKKAEEEPDPEEMVLLLGGPRAKSGVDRAVVQAGIVAEAVCWVRDLVSQPSNRLTPALLAQEAGNMARTWGIRHRILDEGDIKALGMGGLLAVASGSKEPPRLILMEHSAKDRAAPKVALVGKGITFDSGGISLKPADKMDLMKYDMAGGAAVLGTMQAASRLGLPVNLVGVVPATENLPSGSAYKPGDVLKTLSGQTVEVTTTDAEGRLILGDALTYALRYRPHLILDLATLTGACVVALGDQVAGIMGNHRGVMEELSRAGELSGEEVWPLPLKEEYEEYLKSDIADVKNAGGRDAGAIQGGLFLKRFVKEVPWVHIDIAGPVWTDKDRPYRPKGATGYGVRLLVEFLKRFKGVKD